MLLFAFLMLWHLVCWHHHTKIYQATKEYRYLLGGIGFFNGSEFDNFSALILARLAVIPLALKATIEFESNQLASGFLQESKIPPLTWHQKK